MAASDTAAQFQPRLHHILSEVDRRCRFGRLQGRASSFAADQDIDWLDSRLPILNANAICIGFAPLRGEARRLQCARCRRLGLFGRCSKHFHKDLPLIAASLDRNDLVVADMTGQFLGDGLQRRIYPGLRRACATRGGLSRSRGAGASRVRSGWMVCPAPRQNQDENCQIEGTQHFISPLEKCPNDGSVQRSSNKLTRIPSRMPRANLSAKRNQPKTRQPEFTAAGPACQPQIVLHKRQLHVSGMASCRFGRVLEALFLLVIPAKAGGAFRRNDEQKPSWSDVPLLPRTAIPLYASQDRQGTYSTTPTPPTTCLHNESCLLLTRREIFTPWC